MSHDWMAEAKRRVEQWNLQEQVNRERQQQLKKQQRLVAQQQQALQQQQIHSELMNVINAVKVKEKLEYIRRHVWRCGQLDFHSELQEVSCILHFEYEVLKFDDGYRTGRWEGGPGGGSTHYYTTPQLLHTAASETLKITVKHYEKQGIVISSLHFGRAVTPSNLISITQEFDDFLYEYCKSRPKPLEKKAEQDQKNRLEEIAYRNYKPPRQKHSKGWFS